MVASIVKTTQLDQVPSIVNLGTTGAVDLIGWGYAENILIIISSSIPCVRPLVTSLRKLTVSSNRTYPGIGETPKQYKNGRSGERSSGGGMGSWAKTPSVFTYSNPGYDKQGFEMIESDGNQAV